MKNLLALTSIAVGTALLAACQTVATNQSELGASKKEMMLTQAGFKAHPVTTAKQKQQVQSLPAGQVSIVKHNGKTFYAYPDASGNQVHTGNRAQYQAYKQAQVQASQQNQGMNIDPDPHGVAINEFDGWGPGPLAPTDGY